MNSKPIVSAVFAAALLAGAFIPVGGAQASTVVFSDNFNSDAQGLNTVPAGWSLTQGTVDIIGTGFFDYFPGNGNYIDLNGSTFQYGGIGTLPPSFGPGHYTLTFNLGGNQVGPNNNDSGPKTTDISLGDWSTTLTLNYNDPLALYSYSFDTTTSGSLAFAMERDGNSNIGNILDNVVLSETPLPTTWAMLLTGFIGFGFFAFRGAKRRPAIAAA